jgi:succinate dehydrogenase / fumarate reductase cytochrome b subunit
MSFHLLSGIRHLVWDMGYGFEIKTANLFGIIVIVLSLIMTTIFWMFAKGVI